METIVHNIRELAGSQRSAAEQLVGHALGEDQQIVIQVVSLEHLKADVTHLDNQGELPEWFNVYEGLSDQEIASLDQAISHRLDLTRPSP